MTALVELSSNFNSDSCSAMGGLTFPESDSLFKKGKKYILGAYRALTHIHILQSPYFEPRYCIDISNRGCDHFWKFKKENTYFLRYYLFKIKGRNSSDSSNSMILIISWCFLSGTPPKGAVVTNTWKLEDRLTNVLTNAEVTWGVYSNSSSKH